MKWFLWMGHGKVGHPLKTVINDFFNRVDAIASFEKIFSNKTENFWTERQFFSPQPGKYIYGLQQIETQKLENTKQLQQKISKILQ